VTTRRAPRSILVVATRRIGDVLLTTPLIRSLARAYPAAAIDVLVYSGTAGALEGNPDCRAVIEIAGRPARGGCATYSTVSPASAAQSPSCQGSSALAA